jgi:thiol-disulfide isomerase/thioredoxin
MKMFFVVRQTWFPNKSIFLCAALLLFFSGQAYAQISAEAKRAFGEANIRVLDQRRNPPNFLLPLLGGGNAELSSYKGKVVFLNFWATWCPPCRDEMPSMEVLYQRFKDRGLEILAVNVGEESAAVQSFIRGNRFTYPVPLDRNSRISSLYGIRAIPASFIIDREGMIVASLVGSILWDDPKVIAAFDALLESR